MVGTETKGKAIREINNANSHVSLLKTPTSYTSCSFLYNITPEQEWWWAGCALFRKYFMIIRICSMKNKIWKSQHSWTICYRPQSWVSSRCSTVCSFFIWNLDFFKEIVLLPGNIIFPTKLVSLSFTFSNHEKVTTVTHKSMSCSPDSLINLL